MNNTVRLVVAAAAVVVIALLGYQLLIAPNVGEPTPSPSESPSAEPSGAATSEPTPTGPVNFTDLVRGGTDLLPGQYLIDYAAPVEVTITVPQEPFETYQTAWFKALYDWGPWHQSNLARLGVAQIENVYVDPCDPALGLRDPAVGPTVDDLETALGSVPGLNLSNESAASIDGYDGRLIVLLGGEIPADCAEDPAVWATTNGDPSLLLLTPGDTTRVWILDVDGTRLVVWASEDQGFAAQGSLQGLVDSIEIEAP
jgi:hypothetical protein